MRREGSGLNVRRSTPLWSTTIRSTGTFPTVAACVIPDRDGATTLSWAWRRENHMRPSRFLSREALPMAKVCSVPIGLAPTIRP